MSRRPPYRKLKTLHDIQLAKERSRYEILVREQAISSATKELGDSFRSMLRASLYQAGQMAAITAVQRIIAARMEKKSR